MKLKIVLLWLLSFFLNFDLVLAAQVKAVNEEKDKVILKLEPDELSAIELEQELIIGVHEKGKLLSATPGLVKKITVQKSSIVVQLDEPTEVLSKNTDVVFLPLFWQLPFLSTWNDSLALNRWPESSVSMAVSLGAGTYDVSNTTSKESGKISLSGWRIHGGMLFEKHVSGIKFLLAQNTTDLRGEFESTNGGGSADYSSKNKTKTTVVQPGIWYSYNSNETVSADYVTYLIKSNIANGSGSFEHTLGVSVPRLAYQYRKPYWDVSLAYLRGASADSVAIDRASGEEEESVLEFKQHSEIQLQFNTGVTKMAVFVFDLKFLNYEKKSGEETPKANDLTNLKLGYNWRVSDANLYYCNLSMVGGKHSQALLGTSTYGFEFGYQEVLDDSYTGVVEMDLRSANGTSSSETTTKAVSLELLVGISRKIGMEKL